MKHKIFNWLLENKELLLRKYISKMITEKENAEDFYQDLFIILGDKKDSILKIAFEERDMLKYTVGIIRNNLQSKNSPYYYKYIRDKWGSYNAELDTRIEDDKTAKYELLNEINNDMQLLDMKIKEYHKDRVKLNGRLWYDNKIMDMYYNEGMTFRGISKQTDIPVSSLFYTVTSSREDLIKRFKKEIKNIKDKIIIYNEWKQ
jgi:hypothetical protein